MRRTRKFGFTVARSRGYDPAIEVRFNIKFGLGHETRSNLLGFGYVINKTIIAMDYMTFSFNTTDGFSYTPYGGLYSAFEAGPSVLNGGAKFDYYSKEASYTGKFGIIKHETGKPLRIEPISYSYLRHGVGFDFNISFSATKVLGPMIETNQMYMKYLGFIPGIQ